MKTLKPPDWLDKWYWQMTVVLICLYVTEIGVWYRTYNRFPSIEWLVVLTIFVAMIFAGPPVLERSARKWYWQVTVLLSGAALALFAGGYFCTSSGPAGYIPAFLVLAIYGGVLLLGDRLTKFIGLLLLVGSLATTHYLQVRGVEWQKALQHSVRSSLSTVE